MAQVTSGFRSILSNPLVYSFFQNLMGAKDIRRNFSDEYIRPFAGVNILDIGCGPGDLLEFLPSPVCYYGFDISDAYIDRARDRFGDSGNFYCKHLEISDLNKLPEFDVVVCSGVLHHLDDAVALKVLELACCALRGGGRLVSIDPCLDPSQSRLAAFLVRHDRGQNVRSIAEYGKLAAMIFSSVKTELRHRNWIPYTHCLMECVK